MDFFPVMKKIYYCHTTIWVNFINISEKAIQKRLCEYIYIKFKKQLKLIAMESRVLGTFGGGYWWEWPKGAFWVARNILYLDLAGGWQRLSPWLNYSQASLSLFSTRPHLWPTTNVDSVQIIFAHPYTESWTNTSKVPNSSRPHP